MNFKKTIRTSKFKKGTGYKVNKYKNQLYFYTLAMNNPKIKLTKYL